jgi:phage regulator Rha-like protein
MLKRTVSQKALVRVESLVRSIRGERVILDSDLARIYGVSTKRLNEQVRRNIGRFPRDFMIRLTSKEHARLRSQNATSNIGRGGRRYIPFSFTEHGAIMAANVLNSKRALQISVYVVRAFVQLRGTLRANKELGRWLQELERRVEKHDGEIHAIFETIRRLMIVPEKPRRQMGFEVNGEAARLRPSSRR